MDLPVQKVKRCLIGGIFFGYIYSDKVLGVRIENCPHSSFLGAGGSDHEEREAPEGFTELVPR